MRAWDEFVSFVRGTRPRPPPGPARPLATAFLVAASLLNLPIVYLLVKATSMAPPLPLLVGLLSMGLAWASGVALEGRRRGTTRALAALGIAEGVLAFVPSVATALDGARWLFVGVALMCAGAMLAGVARVEGVRGRD